MSFALVLPTRCASPSASHKKNKYLTPPIALDRGMYRRFGGSVVAIEGFAEFSAIDGEIVPIPIPPTTRPKATRCESDPCFPHTGAVRPTRDSTDQDIAHYLHVVTTICGDAWTSLVRDGVFKPDDVVQIVPVDGCFTGRPPEPHVTLSEVIAVIIEPDVLANWVRLGCDDHRLLEIIDTIQSTSHEIRSNRVFRTYVLIYVRCMLADIAPGGPRHRLIAADFELTQSPIDMLQEAIERNHLLSILEVKFTEAKVEQALQRVTFARAAKSNKLLATTSLVKQLNEFPHYSKFVVVMGCISCALLIGCVLALIFGAIPRYHQGAIAALGATAGLILMFAGELAGRLFDLPDE